MNMKRLLLALAMAGLLAGCQTPNGNADACAAAKMTYGAYLIYINSGQEPDQGQIDAAKAAAAFLAAYCGASDGTTKTVHQVDNVRVTVNKGDPRTDRWGVPILTLP